MPPAGFFSRKPRTGESAPSGSSNSIFAFGNSTNTTVTPCSGRVCGSDTRAPSASRYSEAAAARSGTTIATWLSRPITRFPRSWLRPEPDELDLDQRPLAEPFPEKTPQHATRRLAQGLVVTPLRRRQRIDRFGQGVADGGSRLRGGFGKADQTDLRRRGQQTGAI